MGMIRPRGKASRIYKAIFSLGEETGRKKRENPRIRGKREDKRMNELISRDYSVNTRPRNS